MNLFLFSPGLGVYSVQLAQGLGKKDHVAIVLNDRDAKNLEREFPDFFDRSHFKTIEAPHYIFPDPRKMFQIGRMFRDIIQHKTEVLHVLVSGTYTEIFAVLWLARKTGLPLVATVHDTRIHPGDFVRAHSAWLHFKVMELCSQIIVHGNHMAEDLIKNYGIDERVVNIVPHGNYDIYLQSSGIPRNYQPERKPGQVLLFGRMKRYKGLDILSRAAPIVAKAIPELKIILAGQGTELDRLEPQLRGLPYFDIQNKYIPAGDAAMLFAESSLLVIPYIEASQSGPLHLAYTCGLPVVATRVGAIPESLTDEKEGILVPPNDPESLAQGIIRMLKNPETAKNYGTAGRKKADTELDWAGAISNKTRRVYDKALEMKTRGILYPGIGSKERWKRFKKRYRASQNEHNG